MKKSKASEDEMWEEDINKKDYVKPEEIKEVIDATFEEDTINLIPVSPMQRARKRLEHRGRKELAGLIENAVDEFFEMLSQRNKDD